MVDRALRSLQTASTPIPRHPTSTYFNLRRTMHGIPEKPRNRTTISLCGPSLYTSSHVRCIEFFVPPWPLQLHMRNAATPISIWCCNVRSNYLRTWLQVSVFYKSLPIRRYLRRLPTCLAAGSCSWGSTITTLNIGIIRNLGDRYGGAPRML